MDVIGESLLALRGNDGQVRVFYSVCRHRASRLLDGPQDHCTRRIICPYHAWSHDFEVGLASVGDRKAFPHLDISRESLVPVEMEIYAGFVFAPLAPGLPSVAEMLSPYKDEIATHEFEKLEPIGRVTLRPRTGNWKDVSEKYSAPYTAPWRIPDYADDSPAAWFHPDALPPVLRRNKGALTKKRNRNGCAANSVACDLHA
jgi:phenylpropionate dioxygenase-like ring-hydroxylating dioxygenase large terminal subunit